RTQAVVHSSAAARAVTVHPESTQEVCKMLAVHPKPAPSPRDEALATVAHELRDSLNTILLALQVHEGATGLAAERFLTGAAHHARRAVRIADDLFDVSAGSLGKLSLRKEVVELAEVVAAATEATAHRLAARGHRLTVSLPAGPVFLFADPV